MQVPSSPLSDVPITPNRRHTAGPVETPYSERQHHMAPPLNDDEAEKRQRRQSARAREEFNRRRSMLISPLRQAQQATAVAADGSGRGAGGAAAVPTPRKKAQAIDVEIMAPLVPKLPSLTKEQMYVNYEEWMKMATDNKINANNSWNFALIDYFHEMTFLRDGDSINFQKASCTLDGCVKIYTSRVDSVASETGKLLSGLADSGGKDDRAADDDGDDDDNGDGEKRTRRRAHRSEATLARDFSSLMLKKLDTEFAVDPLFKKTSADFDEGGARGLLLNHLGVDRDCKIIFDAGDAKAEADEGEEEGGEQEAESQNGEKKRRRMEGNEEGEGEEERELEGEGMDVDEKKESVTEGGVEIDISKLKAKFLPSLQDIFTREICPTLKDFSFDSNATLDLPALRSSDPLEPDLPDLQNAANDDDDDLGDYFDENDSGFVAGNAEDDGATGVAITAAGPLNPIDPTVKEKDYVMAGEENDMFSYFDSAFMRNWAGPEHWKMKRVVNKADKSLTAAGELPDPVEGDDASAPAGSKKKRETFEIDFVNSKDLDEKVLFARAPGRANLTLPVLKEKESKYLKYLLPDDMHFSSKQLLKFFQKPKFTVHTRKRANKEAPLPVSLNEGGGEEADEQFWADQAEAAPNGIEGQADGDVDNTNSANLDVAFPFADVDPDYDDDDPFGYVEHDADDVPDLASAADAGGDSHGYGDNLIAASLRKVKPAYVNYAKTAKKVDVKKLKDNLWREMTVGAAAAPEDDAVMPEDARVVGEQRFTQIMRGLERVYPEKKMKDISVPFCFICLLHLANEKNLKIENAGDESMNELIVVQDG